MLLGSTSRKSRRMDDCVNIIDIEDVAMRQIVCVLRQLNIDVYKDKNTNELYCQIFN